MKPPSKIIIATAAHFIFLAVMLVIIWINVHWSVAVLCTWMAFTISRFATMVSKFRHEMVKSIKAVDQKQNRTTAEFNRFIDTINEQAHALKVAVVDEALKKAPPIEIPKEKPLVVCTKCKEEGYTDTHYKQGNCPIHN